MAVARSCDCCDLWRPRAFLAPAARRVAKLASPTTLLDVSKGPKPAHPGTRSRLGRAESQQPEKQQPPPEMSALQAGLRRVGVLAAAAARGCSSSGGCGAAAAGAALRECSNGASSSRGLHSLCAPGPASQAPPLRQPPLQQRDGDGSGGASSSGAPPLGAPDSSSSGSSGSGPMLCGHPKDKISSHRAGNRRRIYYKKPQGLLAFCRCGVPTAAAG